MGIHFYALVDIFARRLYDLEYVSFEGMEAVDSEQSQINISTPGTKLDISFEGGG